MREDQKVPERLHPGTVAVAVNRAMLNIVALTVAAVVFLASFYPRSLFLPTVSSLLTVCAIASAMIAFLRLHKPGAVHFTLWDVSAVLMLVALGAGMFTDSAAVQTYLQSIATTETSAAVGNTAQPPTPRLQTNEVIP